MGFTHFQTELSKRWATTISVQSSTPRCCTQCCFRVSFHLGTLSTFCWCILVLPLDKGSGFGFQYHFPSPFWLWSYNLFWREQLCESKICSSRFIWLHITGCPHKMLQQSQEAIILLGRWVAVKIGSQWQFLLFPPNSFWDDLLASSSQGPSVRVHPMTVLLPVGRGKEKAWVGFSFLQLAQGFSFPGSAHGVMADRRHFQMLQWSPSETEAARIIFTFLNSCLICFEI